MSPKETTQKKMAPKEMTQKKMAPKEMTQKKAAPKEMTQKKMAPKEMTQKERDILQGAIQEFSQKGYDGASMNDICRRSAVSKGLLYYYYRSKKDLYLQCIRKITTDYMEIVDMEEISSMKLMEAFHFVEKLKLEYFQRHKAEIRLMLNSFYRTPQDVQQEIREEFEFMGEGNVLFIGQLLEKEEMRFGVSPKVAAEVLLGASTNFMKHYVQTALQEEGDVNFQELSKDYSEFLDVVLYGILEKKTK